MAGIHLHHHDLFDEGPDAIAEQLTKFDDVSQLFVQVNDIFERNPSPIGVLERNPVREVIFGSGRLYADLDLDALSPALHQEVSPTVAQGDDPLAIIHGSVLARRYQVVPWVNIANGAWNGAGGKAVERNCVVDFRGRRVERWLCPNSPELAPMWVAVLGSLIDRYGFSTFLIDRIRYPDWGGEDVRPANLFTCFCATCRTLMSAAGIDVARLLGDMEEVAGLLEARRFEDACRRLSRPLFQEWLTFRQRGVAAMVDRLITGLRDRHPEAQLWLDLWPPAYSWILGQSYPELTRLSPRLKHFPYHRLGGGADVQSLIDHFGRTASGHMDAVRQESAFASFVRLFGLDYDLSYEEFRRRGFPIELVEDQNRRVRALSAPGTYVYTGVQSWNLPPEDLYAAAVASYASDADDVIYYCYGWAATELLGAGNGAREQARRMARKQTAMGARGAE
jgi:hypothetical protein